MSELESRICGVCGINWAAPAPWWSARREDKKTFYCPNGHPRAFIESEAAKLRRERDKLKQDAAYLESRIAAEKAGREAAEHQARAFKGVATKLRKRAAGGACPCCNRTFGDLARHMHTKHPNFAKEEVSAGETIQ